MWQFLDYNTIAFSVSDMPYLKFSLLLSPFHNTAHLFANSRLSIFHTSLAALTEVLITVVHGFYSTKLAQHYAVPQPHTYLRCVFQLHYCYASRTVASPQLTQVVHLAYMPVFVVVE
jgi:hypothetical protein